MVELTLVFKGKSEKVELSDASTAESIFAAAREKFSLEDQNLKLLCKGKQLQPESELPASGAKLMVMATGKREVSAVQSAKSDPTIRSFESEDAAAKHHASQQPKEELSEWGTGQDAKHKFCRFEACTWQSFGTRPSSSTPHAFEARSLLLKIAQDPAIVHIMRQREWTVGLLAEMDPIDDRLSEKMEGGGKRLLGYNSNSGAEIRIRLRTQDLSGFLPYPALIDTLLHELSHNEVGPHNEHFWHLFCQLKVDYLKQLLKLSSRGDLFGGQSALSRAHAAAEVKDIRTSVLSALERDRQMPAGPVQMGMLDGYLSASSAVDAAANGGRRGQNVVGGESAAAASSAMPAAAMTAAERREFLAAKASERMASASSAGSAATTTELLPSLTAEGLSVVVPRIFTPPDGEAMDISDEPAPGPAEEK